MNTGRLIDTCNEDYVHHFKPSQISLTTNLRKDMYILYCIVNLIQIRKKDKAIDIKLFFSIVIRRTGVRTITSYHDIIDQDIYK